MKVGSQQVSQHKLSTKTFLLSYKNEKNLPKII